MKLKAELEVTVNDKTGRFITDQDTSIPVAKEMMLRFANILLQIEDAAKAQAEAQKAEAPVEEPPKES